MNPKMVYSSIKNVKLQNYTKESKPFENIKTAISM